MNSAFSSWQEFWAMGGYAFYVWLAVAFTIIPLIFLIIHIRWQHKALLREVSRQQARERRIAAAQDKETRRVTP